MKNTVHNFHHNSNVNEPFLNLKTDLNSLLNLLKNNFFLVFKI